MKATRTLTVAEICTERAEAFPGEVARLADSLRLSPGGFLEALRAGEIHACPEEGSGCFLPFGHDGLHTRRETRQPLVFTVSKADPTGKEPTPGAVLNITGELAKVRETLPHTVWRARCLNRHVEDAQQVVAALLHLPQGTIDQVLVLLLQQRASLLRVRVDPVPVPPDYGRGAMEERATTIREAAAMPQPAIEDGHSGHYIAGWNAALVQLCRRIEAGEHWKEGAAVETRRLPIHQLDEARPGDRIFFPSEGEGEGS